VVIEPSAGNGAFIDGVKSLTNNFRFYDLEPEHGEIIRQDYLLYNCADDVGDRFRKTRYRESAVRTPVVVGFQVATQRVLHPAFRNRF
jgi:hypothetical protein